MKSKTRSLTLVALVVMLFSAMCFFMVSVNVRADQAETPNATVTVLDPITLKAGEYNLFDGSLKEGTEDRPLQVVMNFKANETLEEAKAGKFGKYKCDFYLTFEGLANDSITAENCYLAGCYGEYGWIVIPVDGLKLEEGVTYPVVSNYDVNLTYENICDYVKDFTAAIYVSPVIFEQNPDFKVTLELKMTNPEDERDVIVVGEPAVYSAKDLVPNADVTVLAPITLKAGEYNQFDGSLKTGTVDRPLQIVMNFKAKESLEEAKTGIFGKYLCDFYLTFDGIKNGTLVADNCYLAGEYGTFGWIVIPTDGLELKESVTYPVVSVGYDASLNYNDICSSVKNFTAAIYIDESILIENPDFKVTLELKMKNPNNENDFFTVGEPAVYDVVSLLGIDVEDVPEVEDDGLAKEENKKAIEKARQELIEKGVSSEEVKDVAPVINITVDTLPDEKGRIVYNVAPTLSAGGQSVKIEEFESEVTFRLPIPTTEKRTAAKVYHNEDLMGVYTVKEENGNKYVEVSSKSFSEYAVEPTDEYVANVGVVGYADLQEAINNANGGTVTLLKDVELTETLNIVKDITVTLDLNSYKISQVKECAESYQMINVEGGLTITGNGTISFKDTSNGDSSASWGAYTIRVTGGKLVVENGTIENLSEQNVNGQEFKHTTFAIFQYSGSTVINGGVIKNENYRSVRLWSGTMSINGGEFVGQIWVQPSLKDVNRELTIINGEFTNSWNDGSSVYVDNTSNVEFKVVNGTFNGKIGCADAQALAGSVENGTFTSEAKNGTNETLLAEGCAFVDNGDGTFSVAIDDKIEYKYVTIYLAEQISMNFYVDLGEYILANKSNAYALFTWGDGYQYVMSIDEAQIKTSTTDGIEYYVFSVELLAEELDVEVTLKFFVNGVQCEDTKTKSVKEYADYILDETNDYNEKEKALMVAVLNYGAAAQALVGETPTANKDLSEEQQNAIKFDANDTAFIDEVNGSVAATTKNGTIDTASIKSLTVLLADRIGIRVYIAINDPKNIAEYSATVNGNKAEIKYNAQKGNYYVEILDIYANMLDDTQTVVLNKGNDSITYTCSALAYVRNMINNKESFESVALDLAKSIYLYSTAVNNYEKAN